MAPPAYQKIQQEILQQDSSDDTLFWLESTYNWRLLEARTSRELICAIECQLSNDTTKRFHPAFFVKDTVFAKKHTYLNHIVLRVTDPSARATPHLLGLPIESFDSASLGLVNPLTKDVIINTLIQDDLWAKDSTQRSCLKALSKEFTTRYPLPAPAGDMHTAGGAIPSGGSSAAVAKGAIFHLFSLSRKKNILS